MKVKCIFIFLSIFSIVIFSSCGSSTGAFLQNEFFNNDDFSRSMLFKRDAKYVYSVDNYNDTNFIVFPTEEEAGDCVVSNAPECDIKAGAASYDDNFVRYDILLHSKVTFSIKSLFGIKIYYSNGYGLYTYFPSTKKFYFYWYDKGGNFMGRDDLDYVKYINKAKFTKVDDEEEFTRISFILSKKYYVTNVFKGDEVHTSVSIFSGVIDTKNIIRSADTTIPVRVYFTY